MDDMVNVIALIPARGGSKSIPRKNIKLLAGAPLIAYSIAAALQSKLVNRVIVSTDDDEIAAVARAWGAEVPFIRPAEFAQDSTPDLPVFIHALDWLKQHENYAVDVVVHLRPTSPFRPPEMVDQSVQALIDDNDADSVRGIVPSGENPFKMWLYADDGTIRPLLKVDDIAESFNAPRQILPQTFWQSGHIDVIRPRALHAGSMTGTRIRPYLIDARYTIDIDTLADWDRATWMMEQLDLPVVRANLPPVTDALHAIEQRAAGEGRRFPTNVKLLALDFDGVLTDNRVWVNGDGVEWIAANRSDGMGIGMVKAHGLEVVVISRETDPVVAARCRKLGIACHQGITAKEPILTQLVNERGLDWSQVIYVGNDSNDLGCMALAGFSAAPADSHASALAAADLVLSLNGGHGAVRELCDMIIEHTEQPSA